MSDQVRNESFRTYCLDNTFECETTGLTFHPCEPVDHALSPNIQSLMELRKILREPVNGSAPKIAELWDKCDPETAGNPSGVGDNLACVYL